MNVGYVFDEKFSVPAAVSIVSLLMNNKEMQKINLYILDDGITEESKEKLERLAEQYGRTMTYVDVTKVKQQLSAITEHNWNGSYSTYIRLMLNTLLPEECDRIIMIDADTIIDGKIGELESFVLGDKICAMALEGIPEQYHVYSGLGNSELYNGGVIIVDLAKWREHNVEQSIIDFLVHDRKKNMLTDEDVLSKVLQGEIARIPAKYNYLVQFRLFSTPFFYRLLGWDKLEKNGSFYSLEELKTAGKEAVLYHCIDTQTNRPWNKNNTHPYESMFDYYLSHTPWKGYTKTRKAMKFRASVEYNIRKHLPSGLSRLYYAIALKIYYSIGALWYYRDDRKV